MYSEFGYSLAFTLKSTAHVSFTIPAFHFLQSFRLKQK